MTATVQPAPAAAKRAALYLRVSTGRQAEQDLSIPDQRRQHTPIAKIGVTSRRRSSSRRALLPRMIVAQNFRR
jgi:DNA invertase Pin-like site-specific DNA recombinase